MKIGLKEGLEREAPEQKVYAYREVNREIRETLVADIIKNKADIPEDVLPSINKIIEEEDKKIKAKESKGQIVSDIKRGSRTNNYKKGFTVVDAIVNGHKKVLTFANRSLAYKVMKHIKETYENVTLTYEVTQM